METKLNVKILSHTINPELTIATAGKLCYSPSNIEDLRDKQTEESVEKFINMIFGCQHFSVLEHTSFTFGIEGISRSTTHQLVRHRIASYSQQSQRYVKENQFEYVVPDDIKKDESLYNSYEQYMVDLQNGYDAIVDKLMYNYLFDNNYANILYHELKRLKIDIEEFLGWKNNLYDGLSSLKVEYKQLYSSLEKRAIENARYVLPNACETKIIVTMNLRSLINFCNHRCCRRAQDEINQLAWKMVEEVEKISPLLAKCLGATCQFGKCGEGAFSCQRPYPKKK